MSLDKEQMMMELVKLSIRSRVDQLREYSANPAAGAGEADSGFIQGFYQGHEVAVKTVLKILDDTTAQEFISQHFKDKGKGIK